MSETALVPKSTGLARTTSAVRQLATKLERARQTRNERVMRADAEYVESVRRALGEVEPTSVEAQATEAPPTDTAVAV